MYIYIYIYDAIKKVPTVEADIFILLPFRFRSASVFLPLCGNLGWSFRVSFAKCHVMLPLRFRYPSVSLPLCGWTDRFKSLTSHGRA